VQVTNRGVPRAAILLSSVVGFLCVIAAAVSPDTVFLFLLNSSGAIILFVYLLIAISQIVLRRRNGSSSLVVRMWLFPGLSILTVAGIVAVLVQMALDPEIRPQLVLSLGAWAVVLVLYVVTKARGGSVDPVAPVDEASLATPADTVGSGASS
jgi:GABA permease